MFQVNGRLNNRTRDWVDLSVGLTTALECLVAPEARVGHCRSILSALSDQNLIGVQPLRLILTIT